MSGKKGILRSLTIDALTTSLSPVIAPPEPDLTPEELLARAEALRPILRERQAETEAAGKLLDETHERSSTQGSTGRSSLAVSAATSSASATSCAMMSEISRGCPSSGWVLALTAGHPNLLAHFSEQAQVEVYGTDGDVRVPGRPVQAGDALPADGGYLVSGAWDYASGCDHATHFMGSAIVRGSEPPHLHLAPDRPRRLLDRRQLGRDRSPRHRLEARRLRERLRARAPDDHGGRDDRRAVARDGAHTRTRCTPAPSSRCCSSRSALSPSASHAARSTSTRTSCEQADRHSALHAAGRGRPSTSTTSARRSASSTSPRPRCSRGRSAISSRPRELSRRAGRSTRSARRHGACCCSSSSASASRRKPSRCSSGRAGRAVRGPATRSGTRCSR